ncbi:tandem-type lipoprotein [Carnobacterium sp.]|uniref:tandem-type lipoprotein n=1 Tax=Carnobacterium sp. TaxID=48221 RepID=UPI002FC6B990
MNKKILILGTIGGLLIMSGLSACKTKNKAEVEQGFEQVLAMYPTKNLMDFYDMEGYRDDEFEKEDKGVWSLITSMSVQEEDSPLIDEGMVLRLNRNTHTARGYYYRNETKYLGEGNGFETNEKRYPILYDEEGAHLTTASDSLIANQKLQGFEIIEIISDVALKEKIENFKFFVQYGQFENIDTYKNIQKMYNPEVPMYNLEYQLTNEDRNVKQLRERYTIPTDSSPTLVLSGRGPLDGSSVGSKELTFQFTKNPAIFFSDSISYQPATEEDNQ